MIEAGLMFMFQQGISGYAMSVSKMDQAVAEWRGKCNTLQGLETQRDELNHVIQSCQNSEMTVDLARDAQKRFESTIGNIKGDLALKKKHFQQNIAIMTIGCIVVTAIVVIIINLRAGKLESALNKIDKLNPQG
jgi:hypothetical protein